MFNTRSLPVVTYETEDLNSTVLSPPTSAGVVEMGHTGEWRKVFIFSGPTWSYNKHNHYIYVAVWNLNSLPSNDWKVLPAGNMIVFSKDFVGEVSGSSIR